MSRKFLKIFYYNSEGKITNEIINTLNKKYLVTYYKITFYLKSNYFFLKSKNIHISRHTTLPLSYVMCNYFFKKDKNSQI